MKRKFWAACFLALVFSVNAEAVPDARDSVILESKTVAATAGTGGVVRIRVWITNKDSLAYMALPLVESSLSGGAYMTLSYPRSFSGVVAPLTGTLRYFSVANFKYNSSSPDTFLLAAGYDGGDPATIEPPNLTRRAVWDIKFDSVTSVDPCGGTVEFDSGRVSGQIVQFSTAPPSVDVPVNFVKSTVTVAPSHDFRVSLEHFGPGTIGSWRMTKIECLNVGGCAASATLVWKAPSQASAINGHDRAYPIGGGQSLAVPTTSDATNKIVTWTLPTMEVGEGFRLWALYQIPHNLASGTLLVTTAQAEPFQFDLDSSDNVDTVKKFAVPRTASGNTAGMAAGVAAASAYGEVESIGAIDTLTGTTSIMYAITFQNVGGGAAGDILIQDTLDVNLNEATFDSAGASDSYSLLASGGALAWDFGSIGLPDSLMDPVGSVGFVAFQVEADAGLAEGTEILNQAVLTYDGGTPYVTPPAIIPVCLAARGDVNGDTHLSGADIVTLIGCVFLETGNCTLCNDYNCDGRFSAADIVIEIGAVFLEAVIECL